MKRCKYSSRTMTVASIAAVVALAGSVFAQSVGVDQVLQADQQRINLAQASQERINEVVEGTRSLSDQYRAINKEIDGTDYLFVQWKSGDYSIRGQNPLFYVFTRQLKD